MLQLHERINSLRELIVKDDTEPAARESQAGILLQDVEIFQSEIGELRSLGLKAESKRQSDIQALADAGNGMVDTMKNILVTCQQATQESSEKKSEIVNFETNLTKAENAIESLPDCTDATQGARQLSQLEGIRHDIAQIQRDCMDLLATNPQSKNLQKTYVNASSAEKKRSAKSAQIEGSIRKWDEIADQLNQIELWCQKKENFDEFDDNLERRQVELKSTIEQSERHITTLGDIENDSLLDRVVAIRDKTTAEADDTENIINLTKSIMSELNTVTSDLNTYQTEFNSLGSRVKIQSSIRVHAFSLNLPIKKN